MSFYQYGLKTVNLPERPLIRAINVALENFFEANSEYNLYISNRVEKKRNEDDMDSPDSKEFEYEYSYDYFNKYFGTYIKMYSNVNKNGEKEFDEEGVLWNIYFNVLNFHIKNKGKLVVQSENPLAKALINEVLDNIPCEKVLLKEE